MNLRNKDYLVGMLWASSAILLFGVGFKDNPQGTHLVRVALGLFVTGCIVSKFWITQARDDL